MTSSIRNIPLSRLVDDPMHFKREVTEGRTAELQKSFESVGMLHPVIVRRLPGDNNRFGLIAGGARAEAARNSGAKTIEGRLMKRCTDEMAGQISLRENLDRHLSKEDEKLSRAALAKYLVEKEVTALAAAPMGEVKRPRGRPVSPERAGIKKAAELMKVSEKTIQRSVRPTKKAPMENAAADANGEPTTAGKGGVSELAKGHNAAPTIVEKVAKFVRDMDRFRERHVVQLLVDLANASEDELADVDTRDVDHLASFVSAMQKIQARLPESADSDEEDETAA